MLDALLSDDGFPDLSYTVNSSPGALKTRKANFDGYSVEPIEMKNAMMSVFRSGYSKMVATMNNDAIVKFAQMHDGVDPKYVRPWVVYMRQMERQAFNRPSVFTDEVLSDPTTKLKWTPAYWFSDHVMLQMPWSKMHRWYREITKADAVTELDKVIFKRRNNRDMTAEEEQMIRNERASRALDFSRDANGKLTPRALKNMENASRMFKHFSQFEAKMELASLLFHTRFAVNNVYGGVANDYIYNGFAPMRKSRDITYWNSINNNWKTMDDVHRFFESAGVIESIILKDTGYSGAKKNASVLDKVTDKAAYFMKKTEPWLRREAAMHGYIAARESMALLDLKYNDPFLLSMARKSVEASQFLYDNHNRPAFMATNMGKVFMRFKLWGMNSLKMQGDILRGGAAAGFKEGTPEMARYERMMWATMFMFGLALMFPHTIFQNQLPQPIDLFAGLSGTFFGDDEKNKKKRKNLMSRMDDPLREYFDGLTKIPGVSFPMARIPLGLYDMPAAFRALSSTHVNDIASVTTFNLFPFGRVFVDSYKTYMNPSMAPEFLLKIPLHRIESFENKARKQQLLQRAVEAMKAGEGMDEEDLQTIHNMR